MTTTVIASRHRRTLRLLPALGPSLDVDAVREVMARHGLEFVDSQETRRANELILASGLPPTSAMALAEDLRAIGLHVRVLDGTRFTRSRRVSSAYAWVAIAAIPGLGFCYLGVTSLMAALQYGAAAQVAPAITTIVMGAIPSLYALINYTALQRGGGANLRIGFDRARPVSETKLLSDQLSDLERVLPSHVAGPLLERARKLEAYARRDPDGQAAAELRALVDELNASADQEAVAEARALREEVLRARRALQETGGFS